MEFGEIPYRNGKKASLQRHVSRRAFHGKGCLFYLYSEKVVNNSYALDDSLSALGYMHKLLRFLMIVSGMISCFFEERSFLKHSSGMVKRDK